MIERVRSLWAGLAQVPIQFPSPGQSRVVVSPESLLCPPGWVGIVRLQGATLATVPDPGLVDRVRHAILAARSGNRSSAGRNARTGLAVLSQPRRLHSGQREVHRLPVEHPEIKKLIAGMDQADADEAGLDETTSDAFVIRDTAEVVSASGYRPWANAVAHLSVLTAPHRRDQGHARAAASAAAADALERGLVPQWRTRVEASRRVAGALGFDQLGMQLSLRLSAE